MERLSLLFKQPQPPHTNFLPESVSTELIKRVRGHNRLSFVARKNKETSSTFVGVEEEPSLTYLTIQEPNLTYLTIQEPNLTYLTI